MKECRTAILISGSGSNLQAFIDAVADENLPLDIVCVVSNIKSAYGLERAKAAGIPARHVDHTRFSSREQFDRALSEVLDDFQPELIILAGFMRILSPWFVSRYAGRVLNIHPALLPLYPGLNTHSRVLEANDTDHGSTVHFVTAELDGGPSVLQGRLRVLQGDTADSLKQRVQQVEYRIYPLAARWFAEGRIRLLDDAVEKDGQLMTNPEIIDITSTNAADDA